MINLRIRRTARVLAGSRVVRCERPDLRGTRHGQTVASSSSGLTRLTEPGAAGRNSVAASAPSGGAKGGGPKNWRAGKTPQRTEANSGGWYFTDSVRNRQRKEQNMLRWAAIFFVIAIVAALFGFTGIAGPPA